MASVLYQFSIGFGQSATTIIGNSMGEGDIVNAKRRYRIVQANAVVAISFMTLFVWMYKQEILGLITDLPDVH